MPSKDLLFRPEGDAYGMRLALVFGNEAFAGKCPFYENHCYHCEIGGGEGKQFAHAMNKERLEFFRTYYSAILPEVVHLVIYNSGSTLNRKEMSKKTLDEILTFIKALKNCRIVSFDSRELFITENKVRQVLHSLRNDQQVRLILGIESQSKIIRNDTLNKKMTEGRILKTFEIVAKFHGQVGVDINIILQPPKLVGQEAINEAIATVRYGLRLGREYGVPVDFNLHPYYRTSKGAEKYPNHYGPDLKDVINTVMLLKKILAQEKTASNIFVGCNSEGHDMERKGKRKLSTYLAQVRSINISKALARKRIQ
jgi:hypothetical protein